MYPCVCMCVRAVDSILRTWYRYHVSVPVFAEIETLIVLVLHFSTPEGAGRDGRAGFIGRGDPSDGRLKSMRRRRLSRNSVRLATY